jgi:hypothetical protein
MSLLSGALVTIVALIVIYRPFNPISVGALLSGGLIVLFLGFGGGFVAAFAAFLVLRWFHRFRIWWRPPL